MRNLQNLADLILNWDLIVEVMYVLSGPRWGINLRRSAIRRDSSLCCFDAKIVFGQDDLWVFLDCLEENGYPQIELVREQVRRSKETAYSKFTVPSWLSCLSNQFQHLDIFKDSRYFILSDSRRGVPLFDVSETDGDHVFVCETSADKVFKTREDCFNWLKFQLSSKLEIQNG